MSNRPNPLDKYSTYSYHFLVMATSSTERIRKIFMSSEKKTIYDKIIHHPGQRALGQIKNANIPGFDDLYMLINGFTDGDYFMEDLQYTVNLSNNGALGNPNIFASGVTATVREPHGIMFMNTVKDFMDNKTDAGMAGTFFIIKTIFVGHLPNGKTEYVYDMVKPMVALLTDMSGSFDESGGAYKLEFVDVTNGVAVLHAQMGYIYESMKISGNTLGETIASFENSLNTALQEAREKITALTTKPSDAKQKNKTDVGDKNNSPKIGRLVNYKFTIPAAWKAYKMDGGQRDIIQTLLEQKVKPIDEKVEANPTSPPKDSAQSANQPAPAKQTPQPAPESKKEAPPEPKKDTKPVNEDLTPTAASTAATKSKNKDDVYIGSSARVEVDEVIKEIFKHCIEIAKLPEKNKELEKQGKYSEMRDYRIQNNVTCDNDTYTIHFDVLMYPLMPPKTKSAPKSDAKASNTKADPVKEQQQQQANAKNEAKAQIDANFILDKNTGKFVPKRGLVFDYIFSGKNVDIIDFKMEMGNGLVFLQKDPVSLDGLTGFASGGAPYVKPNEPVNDTNTTKVKGNVKLRRGDPVFLPQRSTDGQMAYNYSTIEHAQNREEYIKMMSEISALSVLEMDMTIRGNPWLLDGTVQQIKSHNFSEYLKELKSEWESSWNSVKTTYDGDAYLQNPNYLMHPLLIKVNIFTPNRFTANPGAQYTTPFWYQGWWMCYTIDNNFVNGSFTQVLHMNAYLLNMGTDNLGVLDDESLNGLYGIKSADPKVKPQNTSSTTSTTKQNTTR